MEKVEDIEIGSDSESEELQENELANMNRHFRNRKNNRGSRNSNEAESMYKDALMDAIFGRFEQASRKLKLIITLAPDNPEPYHLLGTMHEEIGQYDKAVEYLFMSTYLSPPHLEKWIKVADISFQLKMFSQAAYCYGRALKIENYNPNIMLKRAEAFQQSHQTKKAILMYKKIINISKSLQVIKKFAKLRFKRGQYGLSRQILESYDQDYTKNNQIVYMICETYLKEKKYKQIIQLLEKHLDSEETLLQKDEELPVEFLKLIFICCVILKVPCANHQAEDILVSLQDSYQEDYEAFYSDIISHIQQKDQEITFRLIRFLIQHKSHRTVTNYLLLTDYYKKQNQKQNSLKFIEQGIIQHPNSAELMAQHSYLRKYFGIKAPENFRTERIKEKEDIFYSDSEEIQLVNLGQNDHELQGNKSKRRNEDIEEFKNKKQRKKKKEIETEDPKILSKLMEHLNESLHIVLRQIENLEQNNAIRQFDSVLQSLDFLVSISPSTKNKMVHEKKEGLYFKDIGRKRSIQVDHQKINFINANLELILNYVSSLITYMLALLKQRQHRKIIQISQRLSKAHFFKNQNKRHEFKELKIKVYEISLLSCITLRRFNSGIFFMRFLISKCPENELYLLILHFLMRMCKRKTFISSMLSKYVDFKNSHKVQSMIYLLGIQYMETGCFDLAISTFLKINNTTDKNFRKSIYLCLTSCLIQIASSRNTYNKLQFTNRSAFCLAKYSEGEEDSPQVNFRLIKAIFNRGRWFAQVKLNHKAIRQFNKILEIQSDQTLKKKAAYCLLCIYKESEQFVKLDEISSKYFAME